VNPIDPREPAAVEGALADMNAAARARLASSGAGRQRTIFMDLETAGLLETQPDIQLAAIAVDDETGEELEAFEEKIAFDPAIADPKALELNHWTAEAWRNALPWQDVVGRFKRFLLPYHCVTMRSRAGGAYQVAKLCGHNAATFDGPRLRRLFSAADVFAPWDPRVRDTLQLALFYFDQRPQLAPPENMKLGTLAAYFGIPITETHEALADVRLTAALARVLRSRMLQAVAA
jgi:DNA polymerase-3 subunit epsilon